jgi:hypothetical protein
MAAGAPLTNLALGASSVADDLGYVALNDLAVALGDIAADYRVIGGHMVTMLAARWQLGASIYRETGDVDLGIPEIVAREQRITSRLRDISYLQVEGNPADLLCLAAGEPVSCCAGVTEFFGLFPDVTICRTSSA